MKFLDGHTFEVNVEGEQNIDDLKRKVELAEGHPPAQQRIIFAGQELKVRQVCPSCPLFDHLSAILHSRRTNPLRSTMLRMVPCSIWC